MLIQGQWPLLPLLSFQSTVYPMPAGQSGNRLCIFQVNTEIFQNMTTNHNTFGTIIIEHTPQEFNLPTLIHHGAKLYPLYQRGRRLGVLNNDDFV